MSKTNRKQRLLKRHRRHKRLGVLAIILLGVVLGIFVSPWVTLIFAVFCWLAYEAWFSDHLFYSPREDYVYRFGEGVESVPIRWENGRIYLQEFADGNAETGLFLRLRLRASLTGLFVDPGVVIAGGEDCQVFERGVAGWRYVNLTGWAKPLAEGGLAITGRHCRIVGQPELFRLPHLDLRDKCLWIIAPHADDAEIAAFGLYSRRASDVWITTVTAGEIEADVYRKMGLSPEQAAQMKGRARAWDSQAVPQWGGVPPGQCMQLGYFCLQLTAMRQAPEQVFASREAGIDDPRFFRAFNRCRLGSDAADAPNVGTWRGLVADLAELAGRIKPEIVVMPHPVLDPHPDHVATYQAVKEALATAHLRPEKFLLYANHLHDNDRWPMGDAHSGVALPPLLEASAPLLPGVVCLDRQTQVDKAFALSMMHDLQKPLTVKARLRRAIQRLLAGRHPSPYGDDAFLRKAVRRHELFWVEDVDD
jgi:LmbE family N-acetylglucosaminyl deacetylase